MNNKYSQTFFILFAFFLFFLGLYSGKQIWSIDQEERVVQIASCEGYEEEFLKEVGFQNRDECIELNLSLHKQYVDECLEELKPTSNEQHDKKLLDRCVYHSFEKQATFLDSEYFLYKTK